MEIKVRKSTYEDLDQLMTIFSHAREFMKETGNPNQWSDYWPMKDVIIEDIDLGNSYVILADNEIVGTFAFIEGIDETYNVIYEGNWLSNKPYGTIHRIASIGKVKDIFGIALRYALKSGLNIRVDTHKDNKIMQKQLSKYGFVYCGKIYCERNSERIAFEKLNENL